MKRLPEKNFLLKGDESCTYFIVCVSWNYDCGIYTTFYSLLIGSWVSVIIEDGVVTNIRARDIPMEFNVEYSRYEIIRI